MSDEMKEKVAASGKKDERILENLTTLFQMDEELMKNLTENVIKAEVFIMKAAELKLKSGRTDTQKKSNTRIRKEG